MAIASGNPSHTGSRKAGEMRNFITDNKEGLFFLAVIGSHWLAVWLGIDLERTKNRHIQETQYKLDNERKKRGQQ